MNSNTLICQLNGVDLLLNESNHWIVKKGEHKCDVSIDENSIILMWLPLLELEYTTFEERIIDCLKTILLENTESIYNSFPFKKIILSAIYTRSEYWVSLSLKWLESIQIDDEIKAALSTLSSDKVYSQKTRHQAISIVHRINKKMLK